jgi:hypothetical protein
MKKPFCVTTITWTHLPEHPRTNEFVTALTEEGRIIEACYCHHFGGDAWWEDGRGETYDVVAWAKPENMVHT